jgi:hypothetical protein
MTPQQMRKMEKILRLVEEAQAELRAMLAEKSEGRDRWPPSHFNATSVITKLQQIDRAAAENILGEMK